MFVVDTDIISLLQQNHDRLTERIHRADQRIVTTIISRIEILQGRFAAVMKAASGDELLIAFHRLEQSEIHLSGVPLLFFDTASAAEFDRLRQNKKYRKIGRGDLLIAAIVLANRATLVTRNVKDFRQISGLRVENWAD
jgi:tRNA(fMet)-specific endonuclease VapC